MLPDFPLIKTELYKEFSFKLRELILEEPLLASIRHRPHFEGSRMRMRSMDEHEEESAYKRVSSQRSYSRQDIIEHGFKLYLEALPAIAEEMTRQQVEHLFTKMKEVTKRTGNVTKANGPLTFEKYLESLERVWIEFDEQGRPQLPTTVMSPKAGRPFAQDSQQWFQDTDKMRRFEELIERKRQKWNDSESNRKLVD